MHTGSAIDAPRSGPSRIVRTLEIGILHLNFEVDGVTGFFPRDFQSRLTCCQTLLEVIAGNSRHAKHSDTVTVLCGISDDNVIDPCFSNTITGFPFPTHPTSTCYDHSWKPT